MGSRFSKRAQSTIFFIIITVCGKFCYISKAKIKLFAFLHRSTSICVINTVFHYISHRQTNRQIYSYSMCIPILNMFMNGTKVWLMRYICLKGWILVGHYFRNWNKYLFLIVIFTESNMKMKRYGQMSLQPREKQREFTNLDVFTRPSTRVEYYSF